MEFLRKGNTYIIEWKLSYKDGTSITPDDVITVQFMFGRLEKNYPENTDVTYSNELQSFLIELSQEDTFNLLDTTVKVQARVKFNDNSVDSTGIDVVDVKDVLTRKVL